MDNRHLCYIYKHLKAIVGYIVLCRGIKSDKWRSISGDPQESDSVPFVFSYPVRYGVIN